MKFSSGLARSSSCGDQCWRWFAAITPFKRCNTIRSRYFTDCLWLLPDNQILWLFLHFETTFWCCISRLFDPPLHCLLCLPVCVLLVLFGTLIRPLAFPLLCASGRPSFRLCNGLLGLRWRTGNQLDLLLDCSRQKLNHNDILVVRLEVFLQQPQVRQWRWLVQ